MAMPKFPEARVFYRAARERVIDARLIVAAGRTTAGVYLAGYAIECTLKALILGQYARADDRADVVDQFRGGRAHDYIWLRLLYREAAGPTLPPDVSLLFTDVEWWGTELRYNPRTLGPADADEFLSAAEQIMTWADGRL